MVDRDKAPRGPSGSALVVDGLTVVYGGVITALHRIDLTVEPSSTVALLGANGAGKTTIMRAITGLLGRHDAAAVEGSATFAGHDLLRAKSSSIVSGGISHVMEGRRIFPTLSVSDNLRLGGYLRSRSESRRGVDRALELFPTLVGRRDDRAGLLSGGEQQMLAIGRALMQEPKLLLLDEPSLGLAPLVVDEVSGVIQNIAQQGTAVLLVEQNAAMALSIADHAYVLESGRVVRTDTGAALLADDSIREHYLGMSATGRRSFRTSRADRLAAMTGAAE